MVFVCLNSRARTRMTSECMNISVILQFLKNKKKRLLKMNIQKVIFIMSQKMAVLPTLFVLMKFIISLNLIKMIKLLMKKSLVFFLTIMKSLIQLLKAGKNSDMKQIQLSHGVTLILQPVFILCKNNCNKKWTKKYLNLLMIMPG